MRATLLLVALATSTAVAAPSCEPYRRLVEQRQAIESHASVQQQIIDSKLRVLALQRDGMSIAAYFAQQNALNAARVTAETEADAQQRELAAAHRAKHNAAADDRCARGVYVLGR